MHLSFFSKVLFKNINISINKGDKITLVGRNGSGKSSLLNVIAGDLVPDQGVRFIKPGVRIASLSQDYDFSKFTSLEEFIFSDISKDSYYKKEKELTGFKINFGLDPTKCSGGELRKAALLKTFISDSELVLLDEPTNHLDIVTIEYLEKLLERSSKAVIMISHDRRFLQNLSKKVIWLDRGVARALNKGFNFFEDWRDKIFAEEELSLKKLDHKIMREASWAVQGISARRKRNQRRLKELELLREEKGRVIKRPKNISFKFVSGTRTGKVIIEAKGISKAFNGKNIIDNFSFTICAGDRIAVVGPNGAGKTTLLNLLLKKIKPDSGIVKLGSSLKISIFEQNRIKLPESKRVFDFIANNQLLGINFVNDQIVVHGKVRHIAGYLSDYLFSKDQIYGKISSLSGGEKSRLLLAILMAKQSNVLLLDEPTNDLDIETLDLLKEQISVYDGTILFASHDRDFIHSVATHTFSLVENNKIIIDAGGTTHYTVPSSFQFKEKLQKKEANKNLEKSGKSYSKRDLVNDLDAKILLVQGKIDRLNYEIKKLELFLSDQDLYQENHEKFMIVSKELSARQDALRVEEDRWIEYESKKEELSLN